MAKAPKNVQTALKSLWREFKRCSNQYPPLYHEIVEYHEKIRQQLCKFDVDDVCESFHKVFTHNFSDGWHYWHGPEDVAFFGRFSGNGEGLEEFTNLAKSAYLVIGEIDSGDRFVLDSDYQMCDDDEEPPPLGWGYHGWLKLLHEMAFGYPTPLLRYEIIMWNNLIRSDRIATRKEGCAPFPVDVYCTRLVHSVFTSSMAAIEMILDDENAMLVGDMTSGIPVSFSSSEEISSKPKRSPKKGTPKAENAKDTQKDSSPEAIRGTKGATVELPQNIFRLEGQTWHLRFVDGTYVEDGHFRDTLGFRHHAKVLANIGKVFKLTEMDYLGKGKQQELPTLGEVGTEYVDSDEQGEQPKGLKGFEVQNGKPFDPMVDDQGIAKIRIQREHLQANVEIARRSGNPDEILTTQKALADFQSHAGKLFNIFGEVRTFDPGELERARKRVPKALSECLSKLRKAKPPMMKLAQHLEAYVVCEFGTITYLPPSPIEWQTDLPS